MAAVVTIGHHAIVYVSGAAAGTYLGSQLTTQSSGYGGTNNVYTITDTAKRVWHPTADVTPHWTGGPTGTVFIKNRLKGEYISNANETTNTLQIDATWLEMQPLLYCKDFTMSVGKNLVDVTEFLGAYQSWSPALSDVKGTLSNFYDPLQVAAFTPAIPAYFNTKLMADAMIAIKLKVHATLELLAWANIDTEDIKAVVDGVLDQTISWTGAKDIDGHVFSRL